MPGLDERPKGLVLGTVPKEAGLVGPHERGEQKHKQFLSENLNSCYNMCSAARACANGAGKIVGRAEHLGKATEIEFFTPNGRNPLKRLILKK
jgi:hypothetical protein